MLPRTVAALSAVVGGAVWAVAPLVSTQRPVPGGFVYGHLVVAAPVLLVVGLLGFYRAYATAYSAPGRIGIWLFGVGTLGFVPISTHRVLFLYTLPQGLVLFVVAVVGALLAEAGTVGIAVDAWRTETPSRWLVWLPLALPATAAVNYVGATTLGLFSVVFDYHTGVFGLAWVALGYSISADG